MEFGSRSCHSYARHMERHRHFNFGGVYIAQVLAVVKLKSSRYIPSGFDSRAYAAVPMNKGPVQQREQFLLDPIAPVLKTQLPCCFKLELRPY